jgi:hypothetical protein
MHVCNLNGMTREKKINRKFCSPNNQLISLFRPSVAPQSTSLAPNDSIISSKIYLKDIPARIFGNNFSKRGITILMKKYTLI